ncbi:hypothetical protein TgHK011_006195 [Trichoderma gracile]|nr:hypothetical protein TgHK011_006195 [Trichoderma gracile]
MTPLQCLDLFVREHPAQAGILFSGTTVAAVLGPLLGALGFGAGVGADSQGTLAAYLHSLLHPIGAGSLFAILQSAGTGSPLLAAISVAGAAATSGPVFTLVQCLATNGTAT